MTATAKPIVIDIALARTPAIDGPIERIAVLRPVMLGELLCTVPALRALRHGFAQAQITLVGLPWARPLAQRLGCVDRFVEFPGFPGLDECEFDARALPDFLAQMQARRFDLALQMHGGGALNPLASLLGARHSAGFHDEHAWVPHEDDALYLPWPQRGHEIERMLALTDRLGLARRGTQLEFPLTAQDREDLVALWPEAAQRARPYVVVHAGAQLPSRRWLAQRFAQLADQIAARGATVVLTGGAPEAELVNAVAAAMKRPAVNLVGRTQLWTLGALVEGAQAVVCNDSGISHVAAALQRPSVVVSCGADVQRWSPLDRELHRVVWSNPPCRPCAHELCPFDHACARDVEVEDVMKEFSRAEAGSLPDCGRGPLPASGERELNSLLFRDPALIQALR